MTTLQVEHAAKAPAVAFAYGNIAFALNVTKKTTASGEPAPTHRWTMFVRGAYGQDISYAISKVTFTLHPSFTPHIRGEHCCLLPRLALPLDTLSPRFASVLLCCFAEFTAPPYEVTEVGWGAFDVGITIKLRDPAAPVIQLTHLLKLFQDKDTTGPALEKPVVSEHYDEIVFNELPADAAARAALLKGPGRSVPTPSYMEHLTVYSPEPDLAAIAAARKYFGDRVAELQERKRRADAERAALVGQLRELGVL